MIRVVILCVFFGCLSGMFGWFFVCGLVLVCLVIGVVILFGVMFIVLILYWLSLSVRFFMSLFRLCLVVL